MTRPTSIKMRSLRTSLRFFRSIESTFTRSGHTPSPAPGRREALARGAGFDAGPAAELVVRRRRASLSDNTRQLVANGSRREVPMLYVLLPFLVCAAFLLYQLTCKVHCPDCGARLPAFLSPFRKTRRMWRAGGYLCSRCGCETDTAGQKVTADTPPAPFPTLQWALLAGFLLI